MLKQHSRMVMEIKFAIAAFVAGAVFGYVASLWQQAAQRTNQQYRIEHHR